MENMEKAKKLCIENYCIMQENERLRKKARMLKEQNEILLAEIKRREQHNVQQLATSGTGSNATGTNATAASAAAPIAGSINKTPAPTFNDLSLALPNPKNGATRS